MADRLINENDVLALIDAKIDACDRLLGSPQCRGMNRQLLATQISGLRNIADQLKFLPESNMTEADMLAIAAANDGGEAEDLACLG